MEGGRRRGGSSDLRSLDFIFGESSSEEMRCVAEKVLRREESESTISLGSTDVLTVRMAEWFRLTSSMSLFMV